MCRYRKSSLPSSFWSALLLFYIFIFPSPSSPTPKTQAKKKLRISRHTETVFVVSQDTVSCWLGNHGLGLPEYSRWEKQRNTAWLGLALKLKTSAGCFRLCWDYFLQLGKKGKKKKKTHSLFLCDWEMEKLEGIFKQFWWKDDSILVA